MTSEQTASLALISLLLIAAGIVYLHLRGSSASPALQNVYHYAQGPTPFWNGQPVTTVAGTSVPPINPLNPIPLVSSYGTGSDGSGSAWDGSLH